MKKIAIVTNTSWNIYNFRLNLASALKNEGYNIVLIAPYDKYSDILKENFAYHDVVISNKGTNPIEDFKTFLFFFKTYREVKPDVILSYTIKPNIYGTLAANILGIKTIINIAGLGTVFIKQNLLTKLAQQLYKISLSKASKVFFQNRDDFELFIQKKLIAIEKTDILPGSGVDTERFKPTVQDKNDAKSFKFLLIARLLKDKGIFEYADAARVLRKKYKHVEFQLLGSLDSINPTSISKKYIDRWEQEGLVIYLGTTDNVKKYIQNADSIVLPSYYREGTPRVLLEAASMAKPIVTTDNVGCRDVVEDGKTGFLCKARDYKDLADKLEKMMNLPSEEREKMGQLGREKIIKEYDEKIVINKYLSTIKELIG